MNSRIPRIFHFVFGLRPQTEPFHLMYYLCLASCLEVNRPERIILHYQHLPYGPWWELIQDRLTLNRVEPDDILSAYTYSDPKIAAFRYAHLSDLTRLQMLQEYGGVYADIDTIFLRPIASTLYDNSCVMGRERVDWSTPAARRAGGSLCNAMIMAEKNAPFIRLWLDQMHQHFDGSWSAHSTFLPYRLSQEHPSLIHVEAERAFFQLDWSPSGIQALFERETDVPGAYSLHLWSHLWWEWVRTDSTTFHHGRLTPEYVAFAQTTYSKAARPFLPEGLSLSVNRYRRDLLLQRLEDGLFRLRGLGRRALQVLKRQERE